MISERMGAWVRAMGGGVTPGDFAADIVRAQHQPPSPLPGMVLYGLLALLAAMLAWAWLGRLDIVAVAHGKLVPQSFLKIVQPAEAGIVREILVREGDAVEAGQTLVRMDARFAEADGRTLRAELERRRLQLRRIDAELAGGPMKREAEDSPEAYAQAEALLESRRRAHLDALGAERATLAKARHDLVAAAETEEKLRKTVPIYRDQAESWSKLAREGFAGRLLALDRQRIYIESEQDLRVQAQNVAGLKELIALSEKRIAQISSGYHQQLQAERMEAQGQHHRLQQDWDKQLHRQSLLELKAPQAGIVKDLATHTPGSVVAPGTILMTLVPHDEPLVAEVWIDNADAGFVHASQAARVKIAAFPYQKYGMLEGVVRNVGADAQEGRDGANGRPARDAAYRALISLGADPASAGGRRLRLVPGMQVSAEIHLGTRSVVEYLLSPVQKITHEAGRER